jgi:hypothetical protein
VASAAASQKEEARRRREIEEQVLLPFIFISFRREKEEHVFYLFVPSRD